MEKKSYDNLGHAIYAIIFLLAILLYFMVPVDPAKTDSTLQIRQSFLLNLSAGLLAVALVFFVLRFYSFNPEQERVADLQAEMKAMKDLLQVIMTRSLGGKYLKGPQEIYSSALRLYSSVQKSVRVLQVSSLPQPPKDYAEKAAKILKEKRESNCLVTFEAILVLNLSQLPPNFIERIEERNKIYDGVQDQVSLKLLSMENPVGFTVFIVDRSHAHISFSTIQDNVQLESAIEFENNPAICSELVDWYDRIVSPKAVLYKTWKETLNQKKPNPVGTPTA